MTEKEKVKLAERIAKCFSQNGEDWHEWLGEAWIAVEEGKIDIADALCYLKRVRNKERNQEVLLTDLAWWGNGGTHDPQTEVAINDLVEHVWRNLPEKDRKLLDLYLGGSTMKEVGEEFNRDGRWAKARLELIRERLKVRFGTDVLSFLINE